MSAILESVDILHKCNIFSSGSYEQAELSVTRENCTISMKHGHRNFEHIAGKFIGPLLLRPDSLQTEKENILTDRVLTF